MGIAGALSLSAIIAVFFASDFVAEASTLSAGDTVDTEAVAYNPYSDEAIGITAGVGVTPNALVIANNEGGAVVHISHALLEAPGFISLYVMDDEGTAEFVGSSDLLGVAAYDDMEILIDRPTQDGETIIGILYADDGDGEFSLTGADYYLENNGNVITDIDVVGVAQINENVILLEQAKAYIEANTSVEYDS